MAEAMTEEQAAFSEWLHKTYAPEELTSYPNWIADDLNPLLTGAEQSVLNMIIRETCGVSMPNKERKRISYEQFRFGIPTEDGGARGGTGIGQNSIIKSLKVLVNTRVVIQTKGASTSYDECHGAEYMIQQDESEVDYVWLKRRLSQKMAERSANAKKSMEAKAKNKTAREAKGA